jgi:hypothetical protein
VTMKNAVFWDVPPCGSCKNRISRVFLRNVLQLLVAANIVLSSLILLTLMMEAKCSSETSVLTRVTRRHIAEYCILHSDYFPKQRLAVGESAIRRGLLLDQPQILS